MKRFLAVPFLALMTLLSAFAAVPTFLEQNRAHSATGAFGCTVSGASVATPSVITCTGAHNLIDGDPIQITGIGGTTTDNVKGYAKVTGYSTTTFGLYSDANLTSGVTGTGAYTSGGVVTQALNVAAVTGDFTLDMRLENLTASKNVLVSIQESQDGFVADIRTLAVFSYSGPPPTGGTISQSVRKYQLPINRFGTANTTMRLYVQAIDGSATANLTCFLEQ